MLSQSANITKTGFVVANPVGVSPGERVRLREAEKVGQSFGGRQGVSICDEQPNSQNRGEILHRQNYAAVNRNRPFSLLVIRFRGSMFWYEIR